MPKSKKTRIYLNAFTSNTHINVQFRFEQLQIRAFSILCNFNIFIIFFNSIIKILWTKTFLQILFSRVIKPKNANLSGRVHEFQNNT